MDVAYDQVSSGIKNTCKKEIVKGAGTWRRERKTEIPGRTEPTNAS